MDIFKKIISIEDITSLVSEIIKGNPGSVLEIMDATVQACINEGKSNEDIASLVSEIIKYNPELGFIIMDATVQACINEGKSNEDIASLVSEIIKYNPELGFIIMDATVQACINEGKSNEDITYLVSEIIKGNKEFPKLAFEIMNATVQLCIVKEKSIKDICELFNNFGENYIVNLKPILSLLISEYFINKYIFKKTTIVEDREAIDGLYSRFYSNKKFSNITIADIKEMSDSYFENRFLSTNGINGGICSESFLSIISSIPENKKEKWEKSIAKFFSKIKLLNIYENEITSKKDFFEKIGLKSEDFESTEKPYVLVYTSYLNHAFVLAIDTSISWKDAILENKKSIVMIDSSKYIESKKAKELMNENTKIFFDKIPTINLPYQKNKTCWSNAAAAISVISNKCFKFENILNGFNEKSESLIKDIISHITKSFLSNVKKIPDEDNYQKLYGEIKIDISKDNMLTKKIYLANLLKKYVEKLKKNHEKTEDGIEILKLILKNQEQSEKWEKFVLKRRNDNSLFLQKL